MPNAIEFIGALPHTATGKIQKLELRENLRTTSLKIFSKVFSFLFGLLTFLCFGTTVFAQNNIEVLQKLNPAINNVIEFEKDKNLFEVYGNDKLLGYSFITQVLLKL